MKWVEFQEVKKDDRVYIGRQWITITKTQWDKETNRITLFGDTDDGRSVIYIGIFDESIGRDK